MSAYQPELAFADAYQAHWGATISPLHFAQIDPRPADQRQAVQFFENGIAYWNGSAVRWVARNNGSAAATQSPAAEETEMADFNFDDWQKQDREARIKSFVDQGYPQDVAEVMVDAALNVAGAMSDDEAHRKDAQGRGQTVTRVEAPGAGTDQDPSPNPDEFRKSQGR